MEQKLRAKFYKKFGPVFIEDLIGSFYDSYQDKGFSTAFEKLRDNIFTFYRILENNVAYKDAICKLFQKPKALSVTRNEKLEFKIFFQFEFLRNSGNSRPGQRALTKLKPNLDRFRLQMNIAQGSEAFYKFFKEILVANYKALWCFREIAEHLQLEDEIYETPCEKLAPQQNEICETPQKQLAPQRNGISETPRKKPATQRKSFTAPVKKPSITSARSNSTDSPVSVVSPRRPALNRNLHGSFATKKTVRSVPIKRADRPNSDSIDGLKNTGFQRLQQLNRVSFYGKGRQDLRRTELLVKQTPTKEEPQRPNGITGQAVFRNIFAGYSNGN